MIAVDCLFQYTKWQLQPFDMFKAQTTRFCYRYLGVFIKAVI